MPRASAGATCASTEHQTSEMFTAACLEGGSRRPQDCCLLREGARQVSARLGVLHGGHPLSGQRQLACWETKDPLCWAAAACTTSSLASQCTNTVCGCCVLEHRGSAVVKLHQQQQCADASTRSIGCACGVSRFGRASHLGYAAGTLTGAPSTSYPMQSSQLAHAALLRITQPDDNGVLHGNSIGGGLGSHPVPWRL